METTHKSIILTAALVIAAWVFWALLRMYFLAGAIPRGVGLSYTATLAWASGVLLVFLLIYGLTVALVPSRKIWNVGWILAVAGAPIAAPAPLVFAASVLLAITGPIMRYRGRQALRYGIGKSLYIPLRTAFPTMLTMLALTIALMFPALEPPHPQELELIIPEELFLQALRATDDTLSSQLTAFDADARFSDYAVEFTAEKLGTSSQHFTNAQRTQIVDEAKRNLEEQLHIAIDTNRTLGEILYTGSITRLDESLAQYIRFFPYVTAIGLFLLLRFAFFFVRIVVVVIAAFLIRLLIASGFARTIAMQHTVMYPTL